MRTAARSRGRPSLSSLSYGKVNPKLPALWVPPVVFDESDAPSRVSTALKPSCAGGVSVVMTGIAEGLPSSCPPFEQALRRPTGAAGDQPHGLFR